MKLFSRYIHKCKFNNHNQTCYLSQSLPIRNYSYYKHNVSKISLLNHQTFPFSTTKDDNKDDTKDEIKTDAIDTTTSESTLEDIPSTLNKPTSEYKPLIHIHDEQRPQLSILLPNRWPFKRLARKPPEPSEPLNMHEMTTFSGIPAQNFMPSEAEKARTEAMKAQEQKKTKEEKKREARKKFWKKYTMVLLFTPILMYILDNRKAKQMATRRAEYIASATSSNARSIRDMALLNNDELIDLYYWILNEECNNDIDAQMTLDQFERLFVNAVNVVKQRKELNGNDTPNSKKDIRLSREYDDPLTAKDKKRELKWLSKKYEKIKDNRLSSKTNELQAWDLNIFFTEYKLPSSNTIPLKTLFIAVSQITTDTLYNKSEVAFRIFTQQIQQHEPEITYNQLVELINDMIITGHFTTDSLITRRSYFPSQFGILTSEEIAHMIFKAAELDRTQNENKCIKFGEFGDALMKLAEGRRLWEGCIAFFLPKDYKPWIQVWYCSDRSLGEIADAKRKEERRLKKLEEKQKKMQTKLEKQNEENMNVYIGDDVNGGNVETQTN